MRYKSKWLLLIGWLALTPMLSGMVCGRAIDISVLVKNTSRFRLSVGQALSDAGIAAQDGKIPPGVNKTIYLHYIDKIDLLTNERSKDQFTKYKDRIHSIYINRVWLTVDQNTLQLDLPAVEVSIASLQSADFDNGVVAAFPSIPAAKQQQATFLWEPEGYKKTISLLKQYGLQIRLRAPLAIKEGMTYPTGVVDFSMQFDVVFVLKAI